MVRWKGYSATDDTWEPEDNLNCQELIETFLDKVKVAKNASQKDLRLAPKHTKRFTLMDNCSNGRRLSKRNDGRQRSLLFFKLPQKSKH